jgi:predicted nucleotidyltransferase
VAQGIVSADEHPNATLYLLNRDHVAADAVVALTRLRSMIIDRITEALSRWSPEPLHASLFGSFARGEATTTSDIDILVVIGPADAADQDARAAQIDQLSADVLRWTGNRGHIVDPTLDILATMIAADDPLLTSWRADHIHLKGTRLLDLLRSVS